MNINGNHNIVIQNVNDSTITLKIDGEIQEIRNDIAELRKLLQSFGDKQFQVADKIYNIETINEANFGTILKDVKNAVVNSTITAENVQIGDNNTHYHYHQSGKTISRHLTPPPFTTTTFIGREEELRTIHHKLFNEGNLLLLVNGEGGVGKTTLAAQYYHTYQHLYKHTAWVLAQGDLPDTLLNALATPLQLHFPDTMPTEARFKQLLTELVNLSKPCLLIIDNANDLQNLQKHHHDLRRLLNFHILLTTRVSTLNNVRYYPINGLPYEQALQLFKEHYPEHQAQEDEIFRAIHTAVGQNTLVVELLAKNLQQLNPLKQRYTLSNLLQDLQSKGVLGLSQSRQVQTDYTQQTPLQLESTKPEAIIAAMYDLGELPEQEKNLLSLLALLPPEALSFEKIEVMLGKKEEDKEKEEILKMLAIMYENNKEATLQLLQTQGIGEADILAQLQHLQYPAASFTNIDETLPNLAQKGWLTYNENESTFKLSPVVQAVALRKNPPPLYACQGMISTLINKLDYESSHLTGSSYEDAAIYVRYAERLVQTLPTQTEGKIERQHGQTAVLCERIGVYYSITGNLAKALGYFEQFNRLMAELCQNYPDNVGFKNDLAASYSKLGETHSKFGNLTKALGYFEQFNRLMAELYQNYPDNVGFKNDLAVSYSQLGETHSNLGDLSKALGYFEQYAQLSAELCENYPDNVGFKTGLAVSYSKLGQTHSDLGDLAKALGYFEQYAQLSAELCENYPDNVGFKNGLAISCQFLGHTHSNLGDLAKALGYFEQFNRLMAELCENYPDNVGFKNGLAASYSQLGETHSSLRNLTKALVYFEQFNRLMAELCQNYPDNVGFKKGLAISYSKLGETHSSLGNLTKALVYFEQFNRLMAELCQNYPDNVGFKKGLAISYSKLGETHSSLGNLTKALVYFEQFNRLMAELCQNYPDNVGFKHGLATSYQFLGHTHSKLGDLSKALGYFEQGAQLSAELYQNYPDNINFKRGLAISYSKLGQTHSNLGDLSKALGYFEQYAQLSTELCENYPDNVGFKKGLAASYSQLGETHSKLGEFGQSISVF